MEISTLESGTNTGMTIAPLSSFTQFLSCMTRVPSLSSMDNLTPRKVKGVVDPIIAVGAKVVL
jgi:hypothetical protein